MAVRKIFIIFSDANVQSLNEMTAFYDVDAEVWLASDTNPWPVEDIEVAENPME
jgi:hypothetical protein